MVRVTLLLREEDFRALRGDTQNRTADKGRGRGAHARIRESHQGEPRACGQDGGSIGYRTRSQILQAIRSLGRGKPSAAHGFTPTFTTLPLPWRLCRSHQPSPRRSRGHRTHSDLAMTHPMRARTVEAAPWPQPTKRWSFAALTPRQSFATSHFVRWMCVSLHHRALGHAGLVQASGALPLIGAAYHLGVPRVLAGGAGKTLRVCLCLIASYLRV